VLVLVASSAAAAVVQARAMAGTIGKVVPTGAPRPPALSPLEERLPVLRPELDGWREYEALRQGGLDETTLREFFSQRPQRIAKRLVQVTTTLKQAKSDWEAGEGLAQGEKSDDFDPTKDVRDEAPEEGTRGAQLCEAMASLGPVSVKMSQTLSQRPDLVGDEAATALKRLQTSNVPFADDLAWAVVKESLRWRGPVAPGVGVDDSDESTEPLFASITPTPVAAASLGQVYKAVTHGGREVAVKVQRPDAMAVLVKDYMCFFLAWSLIELWWKITPGGFDNGDIKSVITRVATEILDELDYRKEAENGKRFEESLSFLGFVATPDVLHEYSTNRVLVTDWVQGAHLSALPESDGLRMTRMAVEACTASLVLTGYVHADPHEGNLMLSNDGRVVFLDFGLMSTVDPAIMEAFARGIQACLAEDWTTLATAFKETGFVNDPIQYKPPGAAKFEAFGVNPATGVDEGLAQLSKELGEAMGEVEGGTSRFGALATVLNQKLAPRWKMFTPPYVLLLIRTFLTLEGIAARVDPEFNIYEMAMPWAVRRSLSPLSADGIATLRSTLLTADDRVQWDRVLELVSAQKEEDAAAPADASAAATSEAAEQIAKRQSTESAKAQAMNDAVGSLLGSPSGAALRRIIRDIDSTDLSLKLVSREARELRHALALAVCGAFSAPWKARIAMGGVGAPPDVSRSVSEMIHTSAPAGGAPAVRETDARPVSKAALLLRNRQERWKRKMALMLVTSHLKRQFARGGRGALALASLFYLSLRIVVGAARQAVLQLLPGRRAGDAGDAPPAIAAA